MISRCYKPQDAAFRYYGALGVTVCRRWRTSFAAFLADMGLPPPGHSIDRIDPSGPYSRANCRWATRTEQARNRRRTPFVVFRGERMAVAEAAERVGVGENLVRARVRRLGWSLDRALNTPVRRGRRQPTPPRARSGPKKGRPGTLAVLLARFGGEP